MIALLALSLYSFAFGIAIGPVTIIYACDCLPPIGVGLVISFLWFMGSTLSYLFEFCLEFGKTIPFILFLIINILGLIYILIFSIETKGLSLSEVWEKMGMD